MTVPVQNPTITYSANGASRDYAFNFNFFYEADIRVRLNGVTQTSGYVLARTATGGIVTFVPGPPAAGIVIRIDRVIPIERTTAYIEGGPFKAATLNLDFDRMYMIGQDLQRQLDDVVVIANQATSGTLSATNGNITNLTSNIFVSSATNAGILSWTSATGPINVDSQIPNASIGISKLKADELPGGTPSGASLPVLAQEGATFYNTTNSVLYVWRSSQWREVITDLNIANQLVDKVTTSQLQPALETRINLIDDSAAVTGSVNQRIAAVTAANTSSYATLTAQIGVANNNIIDLQNSYSVDSVTTSVTTITKTTATPAIAAYGTWYEFGTYTWTSPALQNDKTKISVTLPFVVSSVTGTGTDHGAVQVRARLRDMTLGADVATGEAFFQPYTRQGAVDYGSLSQSFSIKEVYDACRPGVLVTGHTYKIFLEVGKFQITDTPTFTVTLGTPRIDDAITATIVA